MSLPCLQPKHKAWTGLYRAHRRAVYRHCRKLLTDCAGAEDATQEVFTRAFHHLQGIGDHDHQRRWLFRVATNYCLNQLRNQRRQTELLLHLDTPPPDDPSSAMFARDVAARMTRGVPDQARRVAWLLYVDELDQHEVADVLGVSRRTVVNRLATFRDGVRRAVASMGEAPVLSNTLAR